MGLLDEEYLRQGRGWGPNQKDLPITDPAQEYAVAPIRKLKNSVKTRYNSLVEDNKKHKAGKINAGEVALRTASETIGAMGDALFTPLGYLPDVDMPSSVKTAGALLASVPLLNQGVKDIAAGVANTPGAKVAAAYISDEEVQRNLGAAVNVGSVGLGAKLNQVGKAMRSYGDDATKGGILNTLSNFIKGHYGASRQSKPGWFEENLSIDSHGKLSPEQVLALKENIQGKLEVGQNAVLGPLEHLLSPTSRALYGSQGITTPAQTHVKRHTANIGTDNLALQKAVGQVQYGSHIGVQAGRKGATNEAADELVNRSYLQGYTANEPGAIQAALNKYPNKVDRVPRKKPLESSSPAWQEVPEIPNNPNDSRVVEEALRSLTGFDQFVVKAPSSIATGGHRHDLVKNNPVNPILKTLFGKTGTKRNPDGTLDIAALTDDLIKAQPKDQSRMPKGAGWRVFNKDPEWIAQNGLWIRGGKIGTSVTEGGVGFLMKVEPDGTISSYMFDKHDFLEKLPGANLVMGKLIPNDVMAVTPAMKYHIKVAPSGKRKNAASEALDAVTTGHFKAPVANKGTDDTFTDLLSRYANAVPNPRDVQAERLRNVGGIMITGGLLGAPENR